VRGEVLISAERAGRCLEHELRLAQRSQRYPENAILVIIRSSPRSLKSKPRLARAAWPRQREQSQILTPEQLEHLGELPLPPDKRRARHR
jgi:hypothetical protein